MIWFACCYLVLQVLRKGCNIIQDICWNVGVEERCKFHLQMQLCEKTASLPYIAFEDGKTHDQILRARGSIDSMSVTQAYTNLLAVAESALTTLGLLIVMTRYSFWYCPIVLLSVLPFLVGRLAAGKDFYTMRWFQAPRVRKRNYFYSLFPMSAFQKEQRIFGFGERMKEHWEQHREQVAEETISFHSKDSARLARSEQWVTTGYMVSILLSFLLTVRNKVSIGVFGAGIYAFRTAQTSTESLLSLYGILIENLMDADMFFLFLSLEDEPVRSMPISHLHQGIQMKNVRFTYPGGAAPALDIRNLSIAAGERIVVVGENGSGKSTLGKILTGIYTPDEGEVLYDGVDLNEISREDLSKLIGTLSQDFVPYHLPICHQVGLRAPLAAKDSEKIRDALRQAGLDVSLEQEKWLGQEFGGIELSGGQWQRLAIATVLCKSCEVILLDEPTSALDPNGEHEILRQFIELSHGKTALIISHRVGLCRLADRVIFMQAGSIKATGSHQYLMDTCDAYRSFYHAQAKWHTGIR